MKTCKKCKIEKTLDSFSKKSNTPDKLCTWCKQCKKEADRSWYKDNKQTKLDTNSKWKQDNQEYNREWFRIYKKKREAVDPVFKITNKLRTRLWYALKNKQKTGSAVKDLGCSTGELKLYLESKWLPGMTWNNWGKGKDKWNIDHIVPLCTFNLENKEELEKACHYSNLQPIWEIDHINKTTNDITTYREP